MGNIGGVADPKAKKTNDAVDRKGRGRAAREWRKYAVPLSIQVVLSSPKQFRHRFSDFEWAVLRAFYPRNVYGTWTDGTNTGVLVGRILGMTGRSKEVRQARRTAERTAYELVYRYLPTLRKWKNGQALDADERRVLAKHRRARTSRKSVEDPGSVIPSGEDQDLAFVPVDKFGKPHPRAMRFTDIAPGWTGRGTEEDVEILNRRLAEEVTDDIDDAEEFD